MRKPLACAFFLAASLGVAYASGNPEAGQAKAVVCVACHGADGNSTIPMWPKLAGQQPSYTFRQLKAFQTGERLDPVMQPQAASLAEQDMLDLAAFFAKQTPTIGQVVDPAKAAWGEKIYRQGIQMRGISACIACHGPNGEGMPGDIFPALRGQHPQYISKAIKEYRDGARTTDPNLLMRTIAKNMSDEEIEAAAHYVASMR